MCEGERKRNTPRGVALPGVRTPGRMAVFTGMLCEKKKTKGDRNETRARDLNPKHARLSAFSNIAPPSLDMFI